MGRPIITTNWDRRAILGQNPMDIITTGFWDDTAFWQDDKVWWDAGGAGTGWIPRTKTTTNWN